MDDTPTRGPERSPDAREPVELLLRDRRAHRDGLSSRDAARRLVVHGPKVHTKGAPESVLPLCRDIGLRERGAARAMSDAALDGLLREPGDLLLARSSRRRSCGSPTRCGPRGMSSR